ncbi:MAG: methylated-DNA--[protein]-cysteine S-methyltransferase [Bacteroidales bacterium]|nr:methylated-DNA--[protein]-cysteine S-methyltransferase [Bacteroidales bacterium]
MEEAIYSSPVGLLNISGSDAGIRSILYGDFVKENDMVPDCLVECIQQLDEYFNGRRKVFNLLLDAEGTDFQLRIWKLLQDIPFGKTLSYLELARISGDIKAVRAVGHANGQNKLNIVVPCHRVIGSNQKLVGYGGGLWRKEWLLKHEASFDMPGLFQQEC